MAVLQSIGSRYRIGDRRHAIDLKTPAASANTMSDAGAESETTLYAGVRASMRSLQGRERLRGAGAAAAMSHEFVMHYLPDIDAKVRVYLGSRRFDVQEVDDVDGLNRTLVLRCMEVS